MREARERHPGRLRHKGQRRTWVLMPGGTRCLVQTPYLLPAPPRRPGRKRTKRGPTGAGDALLAGIAWALERGVSLEKIARWGVASGTAAAVREGVGGGTCAEVEALYEQIQTESAARSEGDRQGG